MFVSPKFHSNKIQFTSFYFLFRFSYFNFFACFFILSFSRNADEERKASAVAAAFAFERRALWSCCSTRVFETWFLYIFLQSCCFFLFFFRLSCLFLPIFRFNAIIYMHHIIQSYYFRCILVCSKSLGMLYTVYTMFCCVLCVWLIRIPTGNSTQKWMRMNEKRTLELFTRREVEYCNVCIYLYVGDGYFSSFLFCFIFFNFFLWVQLMHVFFTLKNRCKGKPTFKHTRESIKRLL